MTTPTLDPLAVACGYCRAPRGERCGARGPNTRRARPAVRPHKRRVQLALAVAAHADPVLGEHFGPATPCGVCGVAGMPQRHRMVDAIAGRLAAGEDLAEVAEDCLVPLAAVEAVSEWAKRWPGVW